MYIALPPPLSFFSSSLFLPFSPSHAGSTALFPRFFFSPPPLPPFLTGYVTSRNETGEGMFGFFSFPLLFLFSLLSQRPPFPSSLSSRGKNPPPPPPLLLLFFPLPPSFGRVCVRSRSCLSGRNGVKSDSDVFSFFPPA